MQNQITEISLSKKITVTSQRADDAKRIIEKFSTKPTLKWSSRVQFWTWKFRWLKSSDLERKFFSCANTFTEQAEKSRGFDTRKGWKNFCWLNTRDGREFVHSTAHVFRTTDQRRVHRMKNNDERKRITPAIMSENECVKRIQCCPFSDFPSGFQNIRTEWWKKKKRRRRGRRVRQWSNVYTHTSTHRRAHLPLLTQATCTKSTPTFLCRTLLHTHAARSEA